VLTLCVDGGLVTFGPGHRVVAVHATGPFPSEGAQAVAARACEQLLAKMRALQRMPPPVRTALNSGQMSKVVVALRALADTDRTCTCSRARRARPVLCARR
jgi:hypothetical protein